MTNEEYRIVKLEKGLFKVEFRYGRWGVWHEVEKNFKSQTKAQEYIISKYKK